MGATTPRSGRPSARLWRRAGARPRPCASGCGKPSAIAASDPARRWRSASESRRYPVARQRVGPPRMRPPATPSCGFGQQFSMAPAPRSRRMLGDACRPRRKSAAALVTGYASNLKRPALSRASELELNNLKVSELNIFSTMAITIRRLRSGIRTRYLGDCTVRSLHAPSPRCPLAALHAA